MLNLVVKILCSSNSSLDKDNGVISFLLHKIVKTFSLGKTIQVIAFLAGLFDAELVKHVMIVAPLSILVNWEKEFTKW